MYAALYAIDLGVPWKTTRYKNFCISAMVSQRLENRWASALPFHFFTPDGRNIALPSQQLSVRN